MQPIVFDRERIARFKQNFIVSALLDYGQRHGFGLNEIAYQAAQGQFKREDMEQLAQLLGYSVSGAGDLSYMRRTLIAKADGEVDKMLRSRKRR